MLNKLRGLSALVGPKVDHPLGDPRELRRIIDEIPGDNTFKALDEVAVIGMSNAELPLA